MLVTFSLVVFAWIFFRAENMPHAFSYIAGIFSPSLFTMPTLLPKTVFLALLILGIIEWCGRDGKYALETIGLRWKRPYRWALYYALMVLFFWLGGKQQAFIYFQF